MWQKLNTKSLEWTCTGWAFGHLVLITDLRDGTCSLWWFGLLDFYHILILTRQSPLISRIFFTIWDSSHWCVILACTGDTNFFMNSCRRLQPWLDKSSINVPVQLMISCQTLDRIQISFLPLVGILKTLLDGHWFQAGKCLSLLRICITL